MWWADRHFGTRALEELAEDIQPESVTRIRILSGSSPGVVTTRVAKDFRRFQLEMAGKAVSAEWRVDTSASDWHDRWLVDDHGPFNVPPINTLFKNDHSEILPTSGRPPVDEWWARSIGLDQAVGRPLQPVASGSHA